MIWRYMNEVKRDLSHEILPEFIPGPMHFDNNISVVKS